MSDVTVVVCAFTRERLRETIACVRALLEQEPAPTQVLVVVDHNEELAAELEEALAPGAEIVRNDGPVPGLSSSRNLALEHARGEIVAFVDDDAIVRRGWLEALVRPFADPAIAGTGGLALPIWEGTRPGWLPEEFLWVVGCSYRGMARSGPVRNVIGCNMAFRADLFADVGGFDLGVGRLGSTPLGCEETEFCIRARRVRGPASVVVVPDALLDHHVTRARQSPRYFVRRCFYEGVSKALIHRLSDSEALASERAYASRALPAAVARDLPALARAGRRDAVGRIAAIAGGLAVTALGYAFGAVRFALRPPQRRPVRITRAAVTET